MHPNKKRLRRSMMFLNCQKPGLIKDPYIYKPDSIMLDLEDAVAENQKDAARYSLFHALQEIDYHGVERVVRINGLDTPHWKEDIRVCVAGGADTIRIAKTETAQDVRTVEEHVLAAEREFGRPEGSTLLMAALESWRCASPQTGSSASPFPAATTQRTFRPPSPAPAWSSWEPDSI